MALFQIPLQHSIEEIIDMSENVNLAKKIYSGVDKQQELETMKIINASEPSLGSSMTEEETRNFLSNGKLFARIGSQQGNNVAEC